MPKTALYCISFAAGLTIGWLVNFRGGQGNWFVSAALPSLATLAAAFFGAKWAFDLENRKQAELQKQETVANCNLALFSLSRMINTLLNYQQQFLKPHENAPLQNIFVRPTLPLEKNIGALNAEKLYFLFKTRDPDLMGRLAAAEEQFRYTIDLINERNRMHLEEIQPKLEQAGFKIGEILTENKLKQALGERLYSTSAITTSGIIEQVKHNIESLHKLSQELWDAAKTEYPQDKFVSITIPSGKQATQNAETASSVEKRG